MQANYSTEAEEKQAKEEQPTQMLLYKQFFKTDDECIGIVNENAELGGNDWSDDRRDDESAFGEDTSQLVELLHCR